MSGSDVEKPEEKLARRRLEPELGPLERTDVRGTSGLPDYKIVAKGTCGHVEVTSLPDKSRMMQRAAIRKRPKFTVPTPGYWILHLRRTVDIRDLQKAPDLDRILDAAQKANPMMMAPGNCPSAIAELMHSLGIEAARFRKAEGSTGTVILSVGSTGASSVAGGGVDLWLESAFQEPSVLKRVKKLRRAAGESRHLYLQVDSASVAGLAIAIGLDTINAPGAAPYELPKYEPPSDLTDLWVWPDSPGPGLHYARDRGWDIVQDVPWE